MTNLSHPGITRIESLIVTSYLLLHQCPILPILNAIQSCLCSPSHFSLVLMTATCLSYCAVLAGSCVSATFAFAWAGIFHFGSSNRPSLCDLQVQFSLLDRRPLNGMLQYCQSHGMKLFTYGSVAGGLLSDKYVEEPKKGLFGECKARACHKPRHNTSHSITPVTA